MADERGREHLAAGEDDEREGEPGEAEGAPEPPGSCCGKRRDLFVAREALLRRQRLVGVKKALQPNRAKPEQAAGRDTDRARKFCAPGYEKNARQADRREYDQPSG